MKKSKWYAKALYLTLALALAIGLTPLTALAGEGDVYISGPGHGKVGQVIEFWAVCSPTPNAMPTWEYGDGGTDTGFQVGHIYDTPGDYTVTVTAIWDTIEQTDEHDIAIDTGLIPQEEYNIIGTTEEFCVPDDYMGHVALWRFEPSAQLGDGWSILAGGKPREGMPDGPDDCVTVHASTWGELMIYADTENFAGYNATTLDAIKKWGKIDYTWLWGWDYDTGEYSDTSGSTQIWWNENDKWWEGKAVLEDAVIGTFITDGGAIFHHLANGADVEWWVMDARAPVHDLPSDIPAGDSEMYGPGLVTLIEDMQAEWPSRLVGFGDCDIKYTATVSGDLDGMTGLTGVELVACGEEAVKVVVVAKYPDELHYNEWPVFPEIISWNFWTQELEKVPQVRWAGEKIVLEKCFGDNYSGNDVSFKLENQSPGCLEAVYWDDWPDQAQTVWTTVQDDGTTRCILTSEAPGECDVTVALWSSNAIRDGRAPSNENGYIINQHGFVVFFLKLEEITLGNVQGSRTGHDSGLWEYPDGSTNPWNSGSNPGDTPGTILDDGPYPDELSQTLNVSQDALLRARVKGWFMGDNLSWREEDLVDLDGDGFAETRLPLGRWVLPDDWPWLAGAEWEELRPRWDIMDQPNDDVMSEIDTNLDKFEELGDYITWDRTGDVDVPDGLVAEFPVIGPYSSLDDYTAFVNTLLDRKTIVRNAKLNWWDCPMPVAKIVFKITDGPGFLKDVNKGHVYYEWVDTSLDEPNPEGIVYTNPFYFTMIPANILIPPFINNGGYDWNSWDDNYGPYPFWEIFNRPPGATPSDDQHSTKVEVYSDNHGEAMVWLNGDWNLDLPVTNGVTDIPEGTEVGDTTVKAMADYPYLRKHLPAVSNDVTKTWTWGKDILGDDLGGRMVYDIEMVEGDKKIAFIWISDRDGQPEVDARVEWRLSDGGADVFIPPFTGEVGDGLENIWVDDGFLADTGGHCTDGVARRQGESWTRLPTDDPDPLVNDEVALFEDMFPGVDVSEYAVAAVEVFDQSGVADVQLTIILYGREGPIIRSINLDFTIPEGPAVAGDANEDGEVNMGDVTTIERIILELDAATVGADADEDGEVNMGDVTKTERIILGL